MGRELPYHPTCLLAYINLAMSRISKEFSLSSGKPVATFPGWKKEHETDFMRSPYGDSGRGFFRNLRYDEFARAFMT
jgi:hypothetical protein